MDNINIHDFVKNISGWEVACKKDNQKILSLYNSLSMSGGSFDIRFVKDPDYFKFNNYENENNYVLIAKNEDGNIESMLSLMVRPCYVNGKIENIGHFADLRSMRKKERKSKASWASIANEFLINGKNVDEIKGCRYFIGSFVEENKYAIQAIKDFSPWEISEIATYNMVSLLARKPLKYSGIAGTVNNNEMTVSIAGIDDLEELKSYLERQSKKRMFGFVFKGGDCELERRLKSWDDYSTSNIYIARDKSGEITGVISCWDPSKGRKILVDKFPLSLEIIGKCLKVFGKKIPAKGAELEILYLTMIEIDHKYSIEERRVIFNMLLDEIYKSGQHKKFHLISFCDYEMENLSDGMEKSYLLQKTKTILYQMYDKGSCDDINIVEEKEQVVHVGHEMVLT